MSPSMLRGIQDCQCGARRKPNQEERPADVRVERSADFVDQRIRFDCLLVVNPVSMNWQMKKFARIAVLVDGMSQRVEICFPRRETVKENEDRPIRIAVEDKGLPKLCHRSVLQRRIGKTKILSSSKIADQTTLSASSALPRVGPDAAPK